MEETYKGQWLPEPLNCDRCGKLLAHGSGDFNCTKIVCVDCVNPLDDLDMDSRI